MYHFVCLDAFFTLLINVSKESKLLFHTSMVSKSHHVTYMRPFKQKIISLFSPLISELTTIQIQNTKFSEATLVKYMTSHKFIRMRHIKIDVPESDLRKSNFLTQRHLQINIFLAISHRFKLPIIYNFTILLITIQYSFLTFW